MSDSDTFIDETPDLHKPVNVDSELKKWLVNYVGDKVKPKDDEITVEMVIKVMAEEFPEFLLVIAEENFIRGYRQALEDVEEGERLAREERKAANA